MSAAERRLTPPPLPAAVERLWAEIIAPCRRCLEHPTLGSRLSAETYIPFTTVGLLPIGARGATYFLVGAEPSPAFETRDEAAERIRDGARNFASGRNESCLQFAMEHWLLAPGEGYYFTDLAKCTMPTDLAKKTPLRYDLCSDYFARELTGLRPRLIISSGLVAYRNLKRQKKSDWPTIFSVLHYSPAARGWHKQVAALATAEHRARVPSEAEFVAFIERRRQSYGYTRPSSKTIGLEHFRLLTAYSVQFAAICAMLANGRLATDDSLMVHVAPGSTT